MHESVNVLGGAIRADFVPQCNMIAFRSGRLNFFPSLPRVLLALFCIQMKSSHETRELIFYFRAICYQSRELASCSLIFKLRLLSQTFSMLACPQNPWYRLTISTQAWTESLLVNFLKLVVVSYSHADYVAVQSNLFFVTWVTLHRKNTA